VNLVAVGRLEPVKGLETLIEAVSHEALIGRVHLHLVGEGPDVKALKALVQAKGLGSVVSFHGFKLNPLDYIAHANFLMLPSLHEGVPYVLLEALALKVPVIASNVGGIPEVVRNGQEALLVEPRSASDLVRVLRRAMPDAPTMAKMAQAGHQRVLAEFSGTVMASRYSELYRALAKRSS
jgi:glycosyltransferase involved in cell wall biosynthesis